MKYGRKPRKNREAARQLSRHSKPPIDTTSLSAQPLVDYGIQEISNPENHVVEDIFQPNQVDLFNFDDSMGLSPLHNVSVESNSPGNNINMGLQDFSLPQPS